MQVAPGHAVTAHLQRVHRVNIPHVHLRPLLRPLPRPLAGHHGVPQGVEVHAGDVLGVASVVPLPLVHPVVDHRHRAHVVHQLALLQHPQVPGEVSSSVTMF